MTEEGFFHINYCISCVSDMLVELITLQMLTLFFPCTNELKSHKCALLTPMAGFNRAKMQCDSVSTTSSLGGITVLGISCRNGCNLGAYII